MSHATNRCPRPARRRSLALLLMIFSLLPAGCLPSRVVIDLAPRDAELAETAVLSDGAKGGGLPKVAMIDVQGLLTHTAAPGLIATRQNAVDTLVTQLAKAEADPQVRAVILRINSPGGTVTASDTLYREITGFRARSGKPVVSSFAEVAASGGYYIALASDRIMAQPSSITGSIGVIIQTFNFSRGMSMIGVEGRALVSKPNKALANPFEPPVESQYAVLQGLVDEFYAEFRALVLARRPALAQGAADQIENATDGRVFTGQTAFEMGLVDAVGDIRDAFALAKELAGVPRAQLVKYHAQGDSVSSVYAMAPQTAPAASGGTNQVSLVHIDGSTNAMLTPGAYYLWRP